MGLGLGLSAAWLQVIAAKPHGRKAARRRPHAATYPRTHRYQPPPAPPPPLQQRLPTRARPPAPGHVRQAVHELRHLVELVEEAGQDVADARQVLRGGGLGVGAVNPSLSLGVPAACANQPCAPQACAPQACPQQARAKAERATAVEGPVSVQAMRPPFLGHPRSAGAVRYTVRYAVQRPHLQENHGPVEAHQAATRATEAMSK